MNRGVLGRGSREAGRSRRLTRHRLLRHPLVYGPAVALLYAAVAKIVTALMALSEGGLAVATFWPLAGLTVVTVLLTPTRWWPWVLACIFVAEVSVDLTAGVPLPTAVGWGLANIGEPLVSATLLVWWGQRHPDLARASDLLRFFACAVFAGPVVGALVGSAASALTWGDFGGAAARWMAGDAIGVLVVAPALLALLDRRSSARISGAPALTALVAGVLLVSFNPTPLGDYPALAFLVTPLLLWLSVEAGARGAAFGVFTVGMIVNLATAVGWGPFAGALGSYFGLLTAQAFLSSIAFSALIVGALTSDLFTRREMETRLRHQASHDPLTGLPNRRLFVERLYASGAARGPDRSLGILYLDLDRFKAVNDLFGHAAGDRVLVETAARLRTATRAGDLVARLGGDEFAVLVQDPGTLEEMRGLAARLRSAACQPVTIGSDPVPVGATVGAAVSADPDKDPDLLLAAADDDMFAQKEQRAQAAPSSTGVPRPRGVPHPGSIGH